MTMIIVRLVIDLGCNDAPADKSMHVLQFMPVIHVRIDIGLVDDTFCVASYGVFFQSILFMLGSFHGINHLCTQFGILFLTQ